MDSYSKLYDRINSGNTFAPANHITITKVDLHYAEGRLEVVPESHNPQGFVHGGALATLADTVSGTAAHTCGTLCVTLSCNLNYLAPASGPYIHCVAKAQKVGKTVTVFDTALTDMQGTLVASGTFTFFHKNTPIPDYTGRD